MKANKMVANHISSDLENMTLASLLEPFGGNDIFYRRLIKVFKKNLEPQLQNIELMISQKNIKELLRLVHTLKGSSGTTGLSSLYQYLCDLESKLAGLEAANEVDTLNSELGQQLRLVAQAEISSIDALLTTDEVNQSTETPSAVDYSVPELTLMLTELMQHLQDQNLKALHITLSLQNKLLGHAHLEHDLTVLCNAVEILDFETAQVALSSLSKKW
ncbi:Hpt domain-containing protein [Shewanella sp. H8]|uniref:Hpt domain-containing protein n=1 Tax=Shewanella sp. H8 TaxID=3342676 RepID=UPI003315FF8B